MMKQVHMSELDEFANEPLFEASEESNEQEEDIENRGINNIDKMALSGTDWTTETIVRQMEKGNIVLDPDFQRRDAWTVTKKSRFIESLILGFPIPQIILAEDKVHKGKFIVIDGKQRLLSLQQFMQNDAQDTPNKRVLRLAGLEVRKDLNGKTYKSMLTAGLDNDIDALSNQPIRTVVVKNWPSVEVLYLVFLRLNTGSVKLSPQELRQALYPGRFIRYANQAASSSQALKSMLHLTGTQADFRMRDVEVFIRYIAFQYCSEKYSGSMQNFLDQTCDELNNRWFELEDDIKGKAEAFELAAECTERVFGINAFNKYKTDHYEGKMNRAVIDIMLYYFSNENIRNDALLHAEAVKTAFETLCKLDNDFLNAIEQTTKSMAAVRTRFCKWAKALSTCLSIEVSSPFGGENE